MAKPDHIFVVGLSRSGTSLMRNILNKAEEVAVGGESHFLKHWIGYQGFQREFARVADISTDAGAKQVVDYIYNLRSNSRRGRGFWGWLQENVDRELFLQRLLESDRNEWILLDLLMEFYADGKPIRGEKTPAHIHSAPVLLKQYPNAKIIHMFRDPRAIFVSTRGWQLTRAHVTLPYRILRHFPVFMTEIFVSFHVIFTWLRVTQLHHQYQQRYPDNYYLCRFEDLVSNPEGALKKLCDFLEIEFTDNMLEISYQNSTVSSQQLSQGFDSSATSRWQKHMSPITYNWIVLWCNKHFPEFHYQALMLIGGIKFVEYWLGSAMV